MQNRVQIQLFKKPYFLKSQLTVPHTGEDTEQLEMSDIVGGNLKCDQLANS